MKGISDCVCCISVHSIEKDSYEGVHTIAKYITQVVVYIFLSQSIMCIIVTVTIEQ